MSRMDEWRKEHPERAKALRRASNRRARERQARLRAIALTTAAEQGGGA
jgi:hypothetical protein